VDVDWIAARVDDPGVRVVEVDVSRAAYEQGHIPGAVLWNAYADLRDGSYRPVGQEELGRLLSRSGVRAETTVVVYGYAAPLGFWLLKALAHTDARILPGTREQWPESGRDWSTDPPDTNETAYPPPAEDADLVASRREVEAAIDDPAQVVVDTRSELEYSGERFWPSGATEDVGRAGHVPGAISVPIASLHEDDGTLKSPDELREIFEQAGVTKDKRVITYCTIGNRASEAWFALTYLLRYPDVRVYYGSWVDWGKAADTPVEI